MSIKGEQNVGMNMSREREKGMEREGAKQGGALSIHNCCLTHWPNSAVPGSE